MFQRTVLVLLLLTAAGFPQRRVDPKNTYHRVICVVPLTGSGTAADPTRPKYAPWPLPVQQIQSTTTQPMPDPPAGIIAFSYVPSDDGRLAIVEFVARARSAFQPIFNDSTIQVFEKGIASKTTIEAALQRYRKDFNLEKFGTVMP